MDGNFEVLESEILQALTELEMRVRTGDEGGAAAKIIIMLIN